MSTVCAPGQASEFLKILRQLSVLLPIRRQPSGFLPIYLARLRCRRDPASDLGGVTEFSANRTPAWVCVTEFSANRTPPYPLIFFWVMSDPHFTVRFLYIASGSRHADGLALQLVPCSLYRVLRCAQVPSGFRERIGSHRIFVSLKPFLKFYAVVRSMFEIFTQIFSILFPGPCTTGCVLLFVVLVFLPSSLCLVSFPYFPMYVSDLSYI